MCSCSPFFSLSLVFTLLAASNFSFSHRRNKILMFFFQQNQYPLLFVSRSSSFSGFQVYVNIKSQSKERLGFVVVFTLLKSGQPAICRRNARGALNAKFHRNLNEGMDVRRDHFVRIKSSLKHSLLSLDNQIISPMVLRCARLAHAKAPGKAKVEIYVNHQQQGPKNKSSQTINSSHSLQSRILRRSLKTLQNKDILYNCNFY